MALPKPVGLESGAKIADFPAPPRIKSVTFTEEPPWHTSRTLDADRDQVDIALEGQMVHLRLKHPRMRTRIGSHVVLSPSAWALLAYDEEPEPAKE